MILLYYKFVNKKANQPVLTIPTPTGCRYGSSREKINSRLLLLFAQYAIRNTDNAPVYEYNP